MKPLQLAQQDGSIQAAGRGAGLDHVTSDKHVSAAQTPYMNHTFWALERRLDMAIFRALFAHSVRTARWLISRGHVKVNGKKMLHPSYLLNPGDMFSVTPDKVLESVGLTKVDVQMRRRVPLDKDSTSALQSSSPADADSSMALAAESDGDDEHLTIDEDYEEEPLDDQSDPQPLQPEDAVNERKAAIKELHTLAVEAESDYHPSGTQKRKLRAIRKHLKDLHGRARRTTNDQLDQVAEELESIVIALEDKGKSHNPAPQSTVPAGNKAQPNPAASKTTHLDALGQISHNHLHPDSAADKAALAAKKYITPWTPKDYMAPFAFIPRYLEVNHTVCSAVYLRHPVVRQGLSEVPSPFSLETGALAFAWYLRRR